MMQGAQTRRSVPQPRGMGWGGSLEGLFKRMGTYIYLRLVHVDIWQKQTKYCKAISLQLKIIKF